ncbi:hypothetical protein N182_34260 [Sinorhizobium sp. GL2]|nr:hypothetical protein N182_34260 [Sinorhizobium sp. GL2]
MGHVAVIDRQDDVAAAKPADAASNILFKTVPKAQRGHSERKLTEVTSLLANEAQIST